MAAQTRDLPTAMVRPAPLSQRPKDATRSATSTVKNRSNDTHSASSDPDARLFGNGRGKACQLCQLAHLLMKNWIGQVIEAMLTQARRTA